jgi:hypothetical protein
MVDGWFDILVFKDNVQKNYGVNADTNVVKLLPNDRAKFVHQNGFHARYDEPNNIPFVEVATSTEDVIV